MTSQPSLLDQIEPHDEKTDQGLTPVEAFHRWAQHNAGAMEMITRMALWSARNGRRCSMKRIFEDVRAAGSVDTTGPAPYKLNNNWTSICARYLMDRHPELAGKFETRSRRAA